MLASCLDILGVDVEVATDGEELLKRLESSSQPPDLVVTDVQMPGVSGLDVLAEVKARYPDVPVMLITAYGDRLTHARAREMGALACYDKPFNLVAFQAGVADALGPSQI